MLASGADVGGAVAAIDSLSLRTAAITAWSTM